MHITEIPEEAIAVTERFFYAIEDIRRSKKIRGLGTLAKKWNVSRHALVMSRLKPADKRIHIEWLFYLARDFGVSCEWLITGNGKMYQ